MRLVCDVELEKACGVGIVVSDADIAAAVKKAIEKDKAGIVEERYHYNVGETLVDTAIAMRCTASQNSVVRLT